MRESCDKGFTLQARGALFVRGDILRCHSTATKPPLQYCTVWYGAACRPVHENLFIMLARSRHCHWSVEVIPHTPLFSRFTSSHSMPTFTLGLPAVVTQCQFVQEGTVAV
jgi:hypothetical protein